MSNITSRFWQGIVGRIRQHRSLRQFEAIPPGVMKDIGYPSIGDGKPKVKRGL